MNIKYLIIYIEECRRVGVEPTFEGLNKYKNFRITSKLEVQ